VKHGTIIKDLCAQVCVCVR